MPWGQDQIRQSGDWGCPQLVAVRLQHICLVKLGGTGELRSQLAESSREILLLALFLT